MNSFEKNHFFLSGKNIWIIRGTFFPTFVDCKSSMDVKGSTWNINTNNESLLVPEQIKPFIPQFLSVLKIISLASIHN